MNKKTYTKINCLIRANENPDSEIVYSGPRTGAEKYLYMTSGTLKDILKKHNIVKGHYVEIQTEEVPYSDSYNPEAYKKYYDKSLRNPINRKEKLAPLKKKSKFETMLEMIKMHLDIYGNTFTNKDPKKYVDALKNKFGYEIETEYRPKRIVKLKISHDTEVYDPIYILTLKSKPQEETNG